MNPLPDTAIKINTDIVDVYALVDPETKKIKYIGKSQVVKSRYRSHLFSKFTPKALKHWRGLLHKKQMKPDLYVLEQVSVEKSIEHERYWIAYFGGVNNLLNTNKMPIKIRRKK